MLTATMNLNTQKNGIELSFSEKPSEAIRNSLKAIGFRWSGKMGIWWAKQTEERLTLANELCGQSKPKAKAKKASKQPKAEAKAKAEPKPKAEPKAETLTLKMGELSEKCAYTIRTSNGFATVKGYVFTATVGRRKLTLGVAKGKDKLWTVTELSTGLAIVSNAEKRYLALAGVDATLVASVYKKLKTDNMKAAAAEMEKHNKGLK